MQREFVYDIRTGRYRYRDTGKFAPQSAILSLTRRNIGLTSKEMETITNLMMSGRMPLGDWQRTTAKMLKTLHIENLLLGRGGLNSVEDEDYLATGRQLKKEYKYLKQFAQDIKSGKVSKAQAMERIKLYARKARYSFWYGRDRSLINNKFMRRHLGGSNHCAECLAYAAMGYQPRNVLPLPTEACTCRSNCLCTVEWVNRLPGQDTLLDSLKRFGRTVGMIG